jgi:hypothetical protein
VEEELIAALYFSFLFNFKFRYVVINVPTVLSVVF